MTVAGLRRAICRLAGLPPLLAALACQPGSASAERPNIVILTLDTTRADRLGSYGYPRPTTPTLDQFAAESLQFDECIVPMATTLPTHTSLFTATHPLEHGVVANVGHGGQPFREAEGLRSFASVARAAGYQTAAFVGAAPLKQGTGIEAGFDVFDEPAAEQRSAAETNTRALEWLADSDDTPFLLWLHYYDPHWPFRPAPAYASQFQPDAALEAFLAARQFASSAPRPLVQADDRALEVNNAYDAELRYLDDQLAVIFSALRQRPDWSATAVLIVGDHGEGLCQHGEAAHGGTWHEQLHAPLLMRVPGTAPGRVPDLIAMVDVLPTFLGRLASADPWRDFLDQTSGRDVLAATADNVVVVSQDTGRRLGEPGYRWALTGPRWKFIAAREPDVELLFDRQADPHELDDVAAAHPEVVTELRQTLARHLRELTPRAPSGPATAVDPALVEQLESLGYTDDD